MVLSGMRTVLLQVPGLQTPRRFALTTQGSGNRPDTWQAIKHVHLRPIGLLRFEVVSDDA